MGGGVYGGRGCRQLKCVRVGRREQQMTRCSPSTSWKTSVGTEDDRADEERIFRSKNKIIFMFSVSILRSVQFYSYLFSCHIISSVYLFVIWHYHKIRLILDVLTGYWCETWVSFFLDQNIRFKSVSPAHPADFGAFANTNNLFILRGYNDFL